MVSAEGLFLEGAFPGGSKSTICFVLWIWRLLPHFVWFGFGGRRLCELGCPGCNMARAESVPAQSQHIKGLPMFRPAFQRTRTTEDSCTNA